MQETNFTALMADAFTNPKKMLAKVKPEMTNLALKNKQDLEQKQLPDYLRTPTADELVEIRQWAIDYKKFHTKASRREVRKATQEHFHIKIFR